MLLEVGTFVNRIENDLNGFIDDLSRITNRHSPYELDAWRKSLPKLSIALSQPGLSSFHIQLGQPGGSLAIEYNLPASSSWCDAVLLGRGESKPSVVMLELKDWDLTGDKPSHRETLIDHHGVLHSHPSDQVRGYVDYCRYFHSEVLQQQASVAGCVFFTSAKDVSVYQGHPYTQLTTQYPVFSYANITGLSNYLSKQLVQPDYEFAFRFEKGVYAQDRNLVRQMADLILKEEEHVFVLIDEQRKGYELCLARMDEFLGGIIPDEKLVVIIEGPPGSGKTVLAAKLWAALSHDSRRRGTVVMTSTSSSQKSNWQSSFEMVARHRAGSGVVIPANKYNPGLAQNWLADQRAKGQQLSPAAWRDNLKLYEQSGGENKMRDNSIGVSVVDEAHALIDPSLRGLEGVASSGWFVMAGPQAYHIMRASQVSIFLMDSDQSYRDNESTTPESIQNWALELGVSPKNIEKISLGDAQFRCGGSKEYVSWLEQTLHLVTTGPQDLSWRKTKNHAGAFLFECVQDPEELETKLREQITVGKSARLVASYGRSWVTKGLTSPHNLPPDQMDFHIPYTRNGETRYWSRIWNYAPSQRYELFVQAPIGSRMHEDPLSEVGCPYVVRGFDYDYLGVLWLADLVWRTDHWDVDTDQVYETAWNLTLSRARTEKHQGITGPATKSLIRQLQRGYRILLSRALAGIYIWFEDDETRDHIASLLGES